RRTLSCFRLRSADRRWRDRFTGDMSLFDPQELTFLAAEHSPSPIEVRRGLEILARLRARRADGHLRALTETRVEQSFNERLFAEVFGYRTLFQHGAGGY